MRGVCLRVELGGQLLQHLELLAQLRQHRRVLAVRQVATHGHVALTDLLGRPLCEIAEPITITDGPAPVLDWLATTIERLLTQSGRDRTCCWRSLGEADRLASARGGANSMLLGPIFASLPHGYNTPR